MSQEMKEAVEICTGRLLPLGVGAVSIMVYLEDPDGLHPRDVIVGPNGVLMSEPDGGECKPISLEALAGDDILTHAQAEVQFEKIKK